MKIEIKNIDSLQGSDVAFLEWQAFVQRSDVECGFWCDPKVIAETSGFEMLQIAFVYDGKQLVAVLPFCYTDGTLPFMLGLWKLGSVRAKMMKLIDYEFAVLNGHNRNVLFDEVIRELKVKKACDLVMADNWPMPGKGARNVQSTYLIDMPENFDAWLNMLNSNTRQALRRRVRKLMRDSNDTVSVKLFRDEGEMELLSKYLHVVWSCSWHGRAQRQAPPSFEVLKTLARSGWVRSYILFVGDTAIASVQGYQYGGVFLDEAPAYDDDWKKYSPGLILNYYIIEELFKSDTPRTVDFGFGYNQYKETLGSRAEVRGQLWRGVNFKGLYAISLLRITDTAFKVGKSLFGGTSVVRRAKARVLNKSI
ncbi:MAG: GNAT family N-acetyltransferase [Kiritimatiellae bacterium]|nr:GNAT family N-acetyltransferase [Kiritimatiellia bacterium]